MQEHIEKNLRQRVNLISKAQNDPILQKAIIARCKKDPIFWCENFIYIDKNNQFFDDDEGLIPFIPFDFQKELIHGIIEACEKRKNVFIEKSRQMGISWVMMIVIVYLWLFHDKKSLILSKREDEVDKIGDIKSCFGKIRFIIKHLPDWMLPTHFTKDIGSLYNKYMLIAKPASTATITGESANPSAGRSGTFDLVFLDEMAFMVNASSINKSVASATGCRVFNSTPHGEGNEYYLMRKLALQEMKAIDDGIIPEEKRRFYFYRLHWSEHPHYTEDWYEAKKREMTPEDVAQELDINYNVSLPGRVYPQFNAPNVSFGNYIYDNSLPLYCSIDNSHGGADPHAVIFAQTKQNKIYIIDSLQYNGTVTDMAGILSGNIKSNTVFSRETLDFMERIRQYKTPTYISDPYDTHSAMNDTSIKREYQKCGIHLQCPDIMTGSYGNVKEQIRLAQINLNRVCVSDEICMDFISAMQNARYPQTNGRTTPADKPIHDWTSHYRTAFEYLIMYLIQNEDKQMKKMNKSPQKHISHNYLTGEIYYV